MTARRVFRGGGTIRNASCSLIVVILMGLIWILLVAGTKWQEMLVGSGSIALAAMFLVIVRRSSTLDLDFSARDLLLAWRLPWYVLADSGVVILFLLKNLLQTSPPSSLYRVCGFATAKDDPRMVARRILATLYTTSTPNSIVIGIDYEQSRMLFHQLEPRPVPDLLVKLGAKA